MKLFTLDEANSLLPVLEALLNRAKEAKRAAEAVEAELAELGRRIYLSGGMRVDLAKVAGQRAAMEKHLARVREMVVEIDEIGVQLKDLDTGLLDFPCRMEDDIVLLCWKSGETAIEHWHTVEAGFRGRRALDERFRRRAGSGPSSGSASGNRPN